MSTRHGEQATGGIMGQGPRLAKTAYVCPSSPEIASVSLSTKETFWIRGKNHANIKVSVTDS